MQLFSLCDLKCICLPAETLLLHVIRAEDLTAILLSVFLLMQNLHVYYLCLCYGLPAQHERESKIYPSIKERKVLSKNNMVNPGICKCWTPVDEWVRYLPGETILGKDYHWPWECRQQTRNPKELWPLCNQATLHPRPPWLCNGKRESISSYSAANQSSESTRLGTENCISYVQEEEGETAGAWDGVMLGVRESVVRERQLVMLHYGMAEQYSCFFMQQIFVLLVLHWYRVMGHLPQVATGG